MHFALFHSRFPEMAEAETRVITILRHDRLPADEYALLESYCEQPECDCRRAMLSVVSRRQQRPLAVIAYGWEDEAFYQRWLRDDDPELISELRGPVLNRLSQQSPLAPALLEIVAEKVLADEAYIGRLKRHYRLFTKALKKEQRKRKNIPPQRRG